MKSALFCFLSLLATTAYCHQEISTQELKDWYDQKVPMVVVDARNKLYSDDTLLPYAKWLPYNSSDEKIRKTLPSQSIPIVSYCWSYNCKMSGWLLDKLKQLGYTSLYEYKAGMKEWEAKGYPTMDP